MVSGPSHQCSSGESLALQLVFDLRPAADESSGADLTTLTHPAVGF
jgi:hypothetical protein